MYNRMEPCHKSIISWSKITYQAGISHGRLETRTSSIDHRYLALAKNNNKWMVLPMKVFSTPHSEVTKIDSTKIQPSVPFVSMSVEFSRGKLFYRKVAFAMK